MTVRALSRLAAADGRRPRIRWKVAGLGILDLAAAALLSCIALALGFSWLQTRVGIAAAAGLLAMTLPVAWRRQRTPMALAAVASGAQHEAHMLLEAWRKHGAQAAGEMVAGGFRGSGAGLVCGGDVGCSCAWAPADTACAGCA